MDRSKEVAMLSQADRLIAEAERAINDQIVDFDKERVAGHDTAMQSGRYAHLQSTARAN
jgi:hypothetical protein